jgi:hypothetical protein
MFKRFSLLLAVLLFGTVLLSACGAGNSPSHANLAMAPASSLPQEMQKAPTSVRESYQFAVANPDALKNVPCYCGCKSIGHTSNLSCFVKEFDGSGQPVAFDNHALGCSLCVDISRDVMKMTGDGKTPTAIHQAILDTYSQYGPANQ